MSLDLDAIKARADAATEGPWYRVGPPWNRGSPWVNAGSEDPHRMRFVCDLDADMAGAEGEGGADNELADAEFIAHAREDVPALVAEARTLRRLLAALVDPSDILPDPCISDPRGRGCQAHGFLDLKPGERCPVAEARELLGGVS